MLERNFTQRVLELWHFLQIDLTQTITTSKHWCSRSHPYHFPNWHSPPNRSLPRSEPAMLLKNSEVKNLKARHVNHRADMSRLWDPVQYRGAVQVWPILRFLSGVASQPCTWWERCRPTVWHKWDRHTVLKCFAMEQAAGV